MTIAQNARKLSEYDALVSWRCRGMFGYPRTEAEKEWCVAEGLRDYVNLVEEQEILLHELQTQIPSL